MNTKKQPVRGLFDEIYLGERRRMRLSKVRARVEHVFGFIEVGMRSSFMRCIGKERARVAIGITNLVYNICRATQLKIDMFGQKCVQTAN